MVFCFGELLLRMSPAPSAQWVHDACMPVYIGGAELNVAAALANWQVPVQYCSVLPRNTLSKDICEVLKAKGIDISPMLFSGNRIGIYYLTQGVDLKHTSVIYDRAYSSFSELTTGMIDWNAVLQNVQWFHCSAISPALNENTAAVCEEAVRAAAKKGLTVSIDLNHRAKLWQYGKAPVDVMPQLVDYCDVVMGNIWSANTLLGIPVDADIHNKGSKKAYLQHADETAEALMKQFPRCKKVAQTFRFDDADGIRYFATLNNVRHQYVSKEYNIKQTKDKVGSGDCFMGGLIYGLYNQKSIWHTINFATAAAVGKMSEVGDSTQQTMTEVEQIINSHE